MSVKLYYRVPLEGIRVGDSDLYNIFRLKFSLPAVLCIYHINYINGLIDGGVAGARELLDAIEKHGEIEIYSDN